MASPRRVQTAIADPKVALNAVPVTITSPPSRMAVVCSWYQDAISWALSDGAGGGMKPASATSPTKNKTTSAGPPHAQRRSEVVFNGSGFIGSPGEYSDVVCPLGSLHWFRCHANATSGSGVKPSRTQFSCEGYAAVQPPSTTTTWPVQYVDVGAQRNSKAASSSTSAPGRPAGHMRRNHFIAASLENISVFI